ncbi:bifunctional metallophosphatase/5'-nucleotidase [Maridesulfovibrio sp.]|uniref:bifunctional metallophosphatase/5'-nucleotidase n=1 Tax=Maridesulfovibrio sp. TaxID=2795000 RepID=UPI0039EE351B
MRILPIIAALLVVLITSSHALADRWDLILLTTSGLNGQLLPAEEKNYPHASSMVRTFGGFARIQSIFELYRTKYPGITITVATGDDLMGKSLGNTKCSTVLGAMHMMGFDISTLGNLEFNRGSRSLVNCLKNKHFPTVISNIKLSKGNPLKKYIKRTAVIERNFVKVGFMGMILPELKLISNPGSGIRVSADIVQSARSTALELKEKKKVDLIVLLSHMTIEQQKLILQEVPQIDIICGGQSYKEILPGQEVIAREGPTPGLMVQSGSHGRYVGVLKIKINANMIKNHEWTIIPITDNTKGDSRIRNFIFDKIHKTEDGSATLAIAPSPLDTRTASIRTEETLAGNIISSILREKFNTDIGFQNGGGIRGDKIIPAGPLTEQDLETMFPFGNNVCILKVTGKTLKQLLERSVHNLPEPSGAFLQLSGIHFVIDLKGQAQVLELDKEGQPIRIKTEGKRVSNIKVMDKTGRYRPIQNNSKYSLATNSYLAHGGDGYIMLQNVPGKVETFVKIREVIKAGMLKEKRLKSKFTPAILRPDKTPYKSGK